MTYERADTIVEFIPQPTLWGHAQLNRTRTRRYMLERIWSKGDRVVMWVMLNPSTADASNDDHTIRKCIGFSQRWGYDGLLVGNLYSYRATDPFDLWSFASEHDAVGKHNDSELKAMASVAETIVFAWGSHGPRPRAAEVYELLHQYAPVMCLGMTVTLQPVHPLRLPYSRSLRPWRPEWLTK